MHDDPQFLLDLSADERSSHRKREALLSSVVLHLLAVILIMVGPDLFPSRLAPPPNQQITQLETAKPPDYLVLPPDYQKLFRRPQTPVLSDKDRLAQGKAPKVDPQGLRMPYSEGNTKEPEQAAAPGVPEPPIALPQPSVPKGDGSSASKGGQEFAEEKNQAALQMPAKPSAQQNSQSLRDVIAGLQTPGASIQSSLEKARQTGNYGYTGSGDGRGLGNFDNRQPNFSVDEPTILSDTRGTDFGPWLRLIYFRVRDNWYSVIPELIRSRASGRVVIIFDVMNNGRIENLEVVRSSGLNPYDRAAISSLKLSEPFPPFPSTFSGPKISMQFTYLYNINR
ncbi:MAG: energy transducer TonB [Acidobacteriota bacterium]